MSDNISKHHQLLDLGKNDLNFQIPSAICVSGPSQSGKSQWIVKVIQNRKELFPIEFHELYYCIPENISLNPNPIFEEIKKQFPSAQLHFGLPDITKLNLNF